MKEIKEEIENKIMTEIRSGDTETLEEMAQRIKDEDIEPPKKQEESMKKEIEEEKELYEDEEYSRRADIDAELELEK